MAKRLREASMSVLRRSLPTDTKVALQFPNMTKNEPCSSGHGGDGLGLGFNPPWPCGPQCSSLPPSACFLPGLGDSVSLAFAALSLLALALGIHLLLQIGKRTTGPVVWCPLTMLLIGDSWVHVLKSSKIRKH